MSEPTTETGRQLSEVRSYHWQMCGLNLDEGDCTCALPIHILAIEAEARADLAARIEKPVHDLIAGSYCHPDQFDTCGDDPFCTDGRAVLAAVLAAIREEAAR